MKLRRLNLNRFLPHQFRPNLRYSYSLLQTKNFCSQLQSEEEIPKSIPLRTPDRDKEKENNKTINDESIIGRRKGVEYNKQQATLQELQEIKKFIETNGDNYNEILFKLKQDVFGYDSSKTTSHHKCESMRRIIWLCTKFLSDKQLYNLMFSNEIENLFDEFTNYFIDGIIWFTTEELCDILWTYSVLGFRPSKLINKIVSKIDRILLHHKNTYFGYKREDIDDNSTKGYGYVPGSLVLPFKHNELADIVFSFGSLRIESGNIVSLLDSIILEHYPEKSTNPTDRAANRLLDGFLPKDLSNLCIGYAMMDPVFHWYKIVWGLNRHLNILSNYIPWTYLEKLNILHYDVTMRYINTGWKLQLTGAMADVIDQNFIKNLARLTPPYHDNMLSELHGIFVELQLDEQYFCKSVEGYQVPFSRWEPRDQPCCIEPLNKLSFTRLDDVNNNKLLLGNALLRQNVLKAMLKKHYKCIPYFEWPPTKHLQHLLIRKYLKQLDNPLPVKQNLLQQTLEPHYHPLQKGVYD